MSVTELHTKMQIEFKMQIRAAIRIKIGFRAESREPANEPGGDGVRTLRIGVPMHCGNCSDRIEDRIGSLDGVRSIDADHERDVVTVEHGPEVFEGQIRARLHEMGFDVSGRSDGEEATT